MTRQDAADLVLCLMHAADSLDGAASRNACDAEDALEKWIERLAREYNLTVERYSYNADRVRVNSS